MHRLNTEMLFSAASWAVRISKSISDSCPVVYLARQILKVTNFVPLAANLDGDQREGNCVALKRMANCAPDNADLAREQDVNNDIETAATAQAFIDLPISHP